MAMVDHQRPLGFGIDVPPYATGPHFSNPWQGEQPEEVSPEHMYPIPSPFHSQPKLETNLSQPMAYPSIPVSTPVTAEPNALNIQYQQPPELHPLDTNVAHGSPSTYRSSSESAFPPTPVSAAVSYHRSLPTSAIQSSQVQPFEAPSFVPGITQAPELDRRVSCMSQPHVNATNFFGSPIEMTRAQRHPSVMEMGRSMTAPHIPYDESFESTRPIVAPMQRSMSRMYSRESGDSYGYASSTPSISSGYVSYPGSMAESITDISSCGSDTYDIHGARLLPRPAGLMGPGILPGPQSMMSQFSSKVASSSQKKHKCKVCDKRFTRPSSLQTHMYSHTGEKPYSCEVPGCGRHFSVVSNLRRHRKVHKHHEMSSIE